MLLRLLLLSVGLLLLVQAQTFYEDDIIEEIENSHPQGLNRRRRMIYNETRVGGRWPKAVVPYLVSSGAMHRAPEYERMFAIYEDSSCIRMPKWNDSVPAIYGLNHKARINLKDGGGCATSATGFWGRSISVSCCARHECLHEIGHAIGFSHEQNNPNRDGWIRANWNDIASNTGTYIKSRDRHWDLTHPYDITGFMNYKPWMYGVRSGSLSMLFPELSINWQYYYFFMEVAYGYKCASFPQCQGKVLKCENDGFQTISHGKCQCECPTGLDPDALCDKPITKVSKQWPKGQYALPKPLTGCPTDGTFKDGDLSISGSDGNSKSNPSHVVGQIEGQQADLSFCTRTVADDVFGSEDEAKFNWPIGSFCIYMKGDKCPTAFSPMSFSYNVLTEKATGQLPDGYHSNMTVEMKFCCQYRGFDFDPILLPTEKPFALIKYHSSCQAITGMHYETESFTLSSSDGFKVDDKTKYWLSKDKKSLTVPLCYYRPADMACGGSIVLSKSNPVATIEIDGKGRSDLECTWVIRGDNENTALVLDFEEFNVKKNGRSCDDTLEVRHARIGQYGLKYCGEKPNHSIRSITNKLLVRFLTNKQSDSSFKAKIMLTDYDDMCYDVPERGASYTGSVNYTRLFKPCLPWAEMTDCYHHPFLEEDVYDSLDGNACRNPDNSFRPWCYTDKNACKRNYCDVCGIEVPYDKVENCDKLKKDGFCTRDAVEAVKYCPKTCFDQLPNNRTPLKKHTEISCPQPTPPSDGDIVGNVKSSYKPGETVQYKCKRGPSSVTSMCLSSGQWSDFGSACPRCPAGALLVDDTCFLSVDGTRENTYDEAVALCKSVHGIVATPKNKKETGTILMAGSFAPTWVGINDRENEGEWKNAEGSDLSWTDWNRVPRNSDRDCAMMKWNAVWYDTSCSDLYSVVCAIPAIDVEDECNDVLGKRCHQLLQDRSDFCKEFPDFSEKYCRRTCRACPHEDAECNVQSSNPNVITLTSKSKISVGEPVSYRCARFSYRTKGDEHRACLPNGKLDGEPLECGECPLGFKKVNDACHGLLGGRILSFKDAVAECNELDGFVAMPKTQAENDAISSVGLGQKIWVGATDRESESTFMWDDGSSLTWSNWDSNEPKKSGRSYDCSAMNPDKSWVNVNCDGMKLPTVCTLPKSGGQICYSKKDKGVTYDGHVNVTIDNQPCINWVENCNVNAFKTKFQGYNMESNYCRNPDNIAGPWCYTNAMSCSWKYCDVCKETHNSPSSNIINIRCGPPSIPSDGEMASAPQSEYMLGDVVSIKCKKNKFVSTTTCLTSGQWSPVGVACTECPANYFAFKDTCYGFVNKALVYDDAKKECGKIGGHLPRPKSLEENDFIKSLNHGKNTWFDAKRYADDAYLSFKWSDGSKVTWLTGKPDPLGCGYINSRGDWHGDRCTFISQSQDLICAVPRLDKTDCGDFLKEQCTQLLLDKPSMCGENKEFAERNCAKTCGLCGDPVECNVESADPLAILSTSKSTITTGQYVEYRCRTGTFITSGNAVRSCLPDGQLSGSDITCGDCPIGYTDHNGNCYGFVDKRLSYENAVKTCKEYNGYIASIQNQEESNYVRSISGRSSIWIGLNDIEEEGKYVWQDGSNAEWTNWSSGEPSGGSEDCVVMYGNQKWNDIPCSSRYTRRFVCSTPKLGEVNCYDVDDKGSSYDGNVQVTKESKPCIPWATATKCHAQPFLRDYAQANLVENYCRNPDNSFAPWCYTDADTCDKQYCSVCEQEKDTDYTKVRCPAPTPPSDGAIVGNVNADYKVGQKVEIACNNENSKKVTTTCLTSGKWSPVGTACMRCPSGYDLFQNKCYRYISTSMVYRDARKYCKKEVGGIISPSKSSEENDFIYTLSNGAYMWIGLNDIETEGTWKWEDGTDVEWTNWQPGEPNDWGNEDAAVMRRNRRWNDVSEWSKKPFVCAVAMKDLQTCVDFLGSQCQLLLDKNANMCKEHVDFATAFCAKTCNLC